MVHRMDDAQWRRFFLICADVLRPGDDRLPATESYCAFTTFDRLQGDLHYWRHGLPLKEEVRQRGTADGGVWGQPFYYEQLAHIIIPRTFGFDIHGEDGRFLEYRERGQDLEALSAALQAEGIEHRLTDLVLEIKCY